MSLNAILEAIRAAGAAQILEIEERAHAQTRGLLADARIEAEQARARAREAALAPALKDRAVLLHRAHMEALQITGAVREALVDAALEQSRGRLAEMRSDTAYPAALRRFLEETLAELGYFTSSAPAERAARIRLQADPRDRALLEQILHDLELDLPVDYSLKCWGGLIAHSEDGRIAANNTLDSRLERAMPHLRRMLGEIFENGVHGRL